MADLPSPIGKAKLKVKAMMTARETVHNWGPWHDYDARQIYHVCQNSWCGYVQIVVKRNAPS